MTASFVDTNILIYAHDADAGEKHRLAKELISDLWESGAGVLSTQVLNEFYVNITRKIPSPLEPASARSVIEPYLTWTIVSPEPSSVLHASEIQQRYQLSYWDALIVHAAAISRAAVLYSEDLNEDQLMEGVRVVNPVSGPAVHDL